MALTHISIIVLGLFMAEFSDEALVEQATLASLFAAASEAQEVCNMPGEGLHMMGYVRQVQPAFDVVNDPGDAHAVSAALRAVKVSIRKLGPRNWCELYMRERDELLRTKAVPECTAMPDACRNMNIVKDDKTRRRPDEPVRQFPSIPSVIAVSL